MLIPEKYFWLALVITIGMFIWGVVEGGSHETQLSDVGELTQIKLTGCGNGTYVVESKEQRCSIIYKTVDLTGSYINIKRIPLNQDGECVCPKGE